MSLELIVPGRALGEIVPPQVCALSGQTTGLTLAPVGVDASRGRWPAGVPTAIQLPFSAAALAQLRRQQRRSVVFAIAPVLAGLGLAATVTSGAVDPEPGTIAALAAAVLVPGILLGRLAQRGAVEVPRARLYRPASVILYFPDSARAAHEAWRAALEAWRRARPEA